MTFTNFIIINQNDLKWLFNRLCERESVLAAKRKKKKNSSWDVQTKFYFLIFRKYKIITITPLLSKCVFYLQTFNIYSKDKNNQSSLINATSYVGSQWLGMLNEPNNIMMNIETKLSEFRWSCHSNLGIIQSFVTRLQPK